MNKLYTLCLALCLTALPGLAQEAYVITAPGDTLRGTLHRERAQELEFSATGGQFKTFSAGEVEGYGNQHGDHFVSRQLTIADTQQAAFFKVVVDGPVALYYTKGVRPEADYYLQRQQEELVPLHRQYFAGTLSSMLSDCPTIAPDKARYSNSSLRNLVSAYNQCRYGSEASTAYTSEHNRVWVKLGIKAGVGYTAGSAEGINNLEAYIFDRETGINAGVFAHFSKQGRGLALQPELWLLQRNTTAEQYFERPNSGSYTGTVNMNALILQLPLLLQYSFGQQKTQPYLLAGPSFSFVLSDDYSHVAVYDAVQKPLNLEMPNGSGGLGFAAGAGLRIPVKQRQLLLELRYSFEHYPATSGFSYKYNTLLLSGGFAF